MDGWYFSDCSLFSRHLGRMSVRGLDPTCPTSIKREPSSPSPSSHGDISPAQPSPGSSSSDTNSSYGLLTKGHTNGLDSPGLYGHTAGLAANGGANRLGCYIILYSITIIISTLTLFLPFFPSTIQEVCRRRRPSEVWVHAGLCGQAAVSGVRWRGVWLPLWRGLLRSLQGLFQENHPR